MKAALPTCIGVIHLPALPGSPGAQALDAVSSLQRAGASAVKEAMILKKTGFDGIIIENFGDAPFYPTSVPPETIVAFSVIAAAVREAVNLPLGINVLRNDARSALAIAAVTGANFIRVNVLSGVAATDQGLIEGKAYELIRERDRLQARNIAIIADIHVKHARSLSSESIELAIEETAGRGGADAVIITGSTTGRAPDENELARAISAASKIKVPLYIGSGLSAEGFETLPSVPIGMIVGSALRKGGKAGAPLEISRMRQFLRAHARWKSTWNGRKIARKSRPASKTSGTKNHGKSRKTASQASR